MGTKAKVSKMRASALRSQPINRYNSVKLYASTDVYTKTGTESDVLGIAWQFRWGGGL